MKGKAIIVRNLNDDQLDILVNYLIANHYKWRYSDLDKKSITRSDILYMQDDKSLSYSSLVIFKQCFEDDYELVVFNNLQMKKQDIKLGMVVEYHCGKRALVISVNDEVLFSDNNGYMRLKDYSDDLLVIDRHSDSDKWDIDKIFQVTFGCSIDTMLNGSFLKLLWERQKEVELTMDEIAEKFGIPVKNLKIKK
jgi:hypothetical protein